MPIVVNSTSIGAQYHPDIIWANDELVVAWTDTSDVTTGPDIRYRTFSAELAPTAEGSFAATSSTEGEVTLAPFAGGTGAFGHTDAQLKQQATYTGHGWDFTTMWKIAEGASYAELQ